MCTHPWKDNNPNKQKYHLQAAASGKFCSYPQLWVFSLPLFFTDLTKGECKPEEPTNQAECTALWEYFREKIIFELFGQHQPHRHELRFLSNVLYPMEIVFSPVFDWFRAFFYEAPFDCFPTIKAFAYMHAPCNVTIVQNTRKRLFRKVLYCLFNWNTKYNVTISIDC